MVKRFAAVFTFSAFAFFLCSCDPVTTHKIATTFIDGLPDLPTPDQYCQDYHEQKEAEARALEEKKAGDRVVVKRSSHAPYAEKACDRCHDKTTESGLIRPRHQICFVCHPNILAGKHLHGPASVGACLECHDPHSAPNPALLKSSKEVLCSNCHQEKRLAAGMHNQVVAKGMLCSDCHDPHAGDSAYFLR